VNRDLDRRRGSGVAAMITVTLRNAAGRTQVAV
jgi:hypothetical protein